jgi:hypothetical protein
VFRSKFKVNGMKKRVGTQGRRKRVEQKVEKMKGEKKRGRSNREIVERIVKVRLEDPYADKSEIKGEADLIDYDRIIHKEFCIDQHLHSQNNNSSIDSFKKVFINTNFNKMKVKEADIPPEVIFNPKVDRIRMEEISLKIKPRRQICNF